MDRTQVSGWGEVGGYMHVCVHRRGMYCRCQNDVQHKSSFYHLKSSPLLQLEAPALCWICSCPYRLAHLQILTSSWLV